MAKAYKPTQPYSKNINTPIIQQKDYYPSWCEFAAKNREQIKAGQIQSGTGIISIYYVPAGKSLWITSLNLMSYGGGVVGIKIEGEGSQIISCAGDPNQASNSFPMPLKVASGLNVYLIVNGAGCNAGAEIQGFLE